MSNPDLIGDPAAMLTTSPSQANASSEVITDQPLLQPIKTPVEVILANANINPEDYPFVLSMEDLQSSDSEQVKIFTQAIQGIQQPDGLMRVLPSIHEIYQFAITSNTLKPIPQPENTLSDAPSTSSNIKLDLSSWLEKHKINPTLNTQFDHGLMALPEGPLKSTLERSIKNEYGKDASATLIKDQDISKTELFFSNDGNELYLLRKLHINGVKIIISGDDFDIPLPGNIYTLIKCTAKTTEAGSAILEKELIAHATNSELFKNMYLNTESFVFKLNDLSLVGARQVVNAQNITLKQYREKLSSSFEHVHNAHLRKIQAKIDGLRKYGNTELTAAEQKNKESKRKKIVQKKYRALEEARITIRLAKHICHVQDLYKTLKTNIHRAYGDNLPTDIKIAEDEIYNIYSDALSHASGAQIEKAHTALKISEARIKLLSEICDAQIEINKLRQKIVEKPTEATAATLGVINKLKSYADKQTRKGTELNIVKAAGALKAILGLVRLTHDYHDTDDNLRQQVRYTDDAISIIESHRAQIASSRFIDWIREKLSSLFSSKEVQSTDNVSKNSISPNKKRKRSLFETEGFKLTEDVEDSILAAKKHLLSSARILSSTIATSPSTNTNKRSGGTPPISHLENNLEVSLSIVKNDDTSVPSVTTTTSSESGSCTANSATSIKTGPDIHFVKELPDQTALTSDKYKDSYIITENDNYEKTISYISADNKIDGPFSVYGLPEEFSKKPGVTYLLDGKQSKALNHYLLDAQRRDLERELLNTAQGSTHEIARFRGRLYQSLKQVILPEEVIRRYNENKDGIIFEPNAKAAWGKYVAFNKQHGKFIKEYEAETQLLTAQNAVRKRTTEETDLENELNANNRPNNHPIVELR